MFVALCIVGGLIGVYLLGALITGFALFIMAGPPWKQPELMQAFVMTVVGWPIFLPGILREIFSSKP